MRVIRTRLLGLLSAIVLTIPATAFAQPGYLCRMTGEVSASCCCAKKQVSKRCEAEIKRSCCQLIEAERTIAPSVAPDTSRLIAAPMVAAIVAQFALDSSGWTYKPTLARITHPPGPPRFLVKCSFLI